MNIVTAICEHPSDVVVVKLLEMAGLDKYGVLAELLCRIMQITEFTPGSLMVCNITVRWGYHSNDPTQSFDVTVTY